MVLREELIKLLKRAVGKCYAHDKLLIDFGMERACVAQIYYYMRRIVDTDDEYASLRSFDFDCEYNRKGENTKITPSRPNGSCPDLIIHKRNSLDNRLDNRLVVEFKPYNTNHRVVNDIEKLKDFTSPKYGYGYQLGVFVHLRREKPAEYRFSLMERKSAKTK